MSDFKDLIRQSTNTTEQYKSNLKIAEQAQIAEHERRFAETFCATLKQHIRKCAEQGNFKIDGNKNIISGLVSMHYVSDIGTEWLFPNDIKSIQGYALSYPGLHGYSNDKFEGKSTVIFHTAVSVEEFKKGGGLLHSSGTCKWTQTFELSYGGKKFLDYAKTMLNEDGIDLSYFWATRTSRSHGPGNAPSVHHQRFDDKKLTVSKQWHESVAVYLVFEFTFEY